MRNCRQTLKNFHLHPIMTIVTRSRRTDLTVNMFLILLILVANVVESSLTQDRFKGKEVHLFCLWQTWLLKQNQLTTGTLTWQRRSDCCLEVDANLVEKKVDWILDTGVSKHFCANKDFFHNFEDVGNGEHAFMENSTITGVLGKGKILLKLTSRKSLTLNNVLHVSSLRRNLVFGD